MADDVVSVITDNWDATIIAIGLVKYLNKLPLKFINKGIGVIREVNDYTPSGMDYKQSDFKSGHIFRIFFKDLNEDNIDLRISALVKICNAFKGNTLYDRFIPRLNEISWGKDENGESVPDFQRVAQMPLVATKNNRNLFT